MPNAVYDFFKNNPEAVEAISGNRNSTSDENPASDFCPFVPFDAPIVPPPFPVHVLPSPLREYVSSEAQYLEVGDAMTAVTAIGACALSAQGKYAISSRDGHVEPLSLFTLCIARPSERYSKNPNLNILLDAYSGYPISVTRKSGTKEIHSPALTIVCMLQPGMWKQLSQDGDFDGRGLLARFLIAFPESKIGARTNRTPPPPQETKDAYAEMIADLLNVVDNCGKPWIITLSNEAKVLADDIFRVIEDDLKDCPRHIDAWLGKLHGQTMRIAGILHCVQHRDNADGVEVSRETLAAAWEIGKYFRTCADLAFGENEESEAESDARYIWERIKRSGQTEIAKGKLQQTCRRFRRASEMEPGLTELVQHGYIRIEERATKGRPSVTVYRNPCAE